MPCSAKCMIFQRKSATKGLVIKQQLSFAAAIRAAFLPLLLESLLLLASCDQGHLVEACDAIAWLPLGANATWTTW